MKKIIFNQEPVLLHRKAGLKYLRMRFNRDSILQLSVPFLCSEKSALGFVRDNWEWVEIHRPHPKEQIIFKDEMQIDVLGQSLVICHVPHQQRGVYCQENRLYVSGQADFIHRRVCTYIQKEFKAYVQQKVVDFTSILGVKAAGVSLKETVSRWGSCSSRKHLNFCWKLAFSPLFVTDYIVAHEVSHLSEMNHGPQFWATVARLNTRQADAQIWLRKNGQQLHHIAGVNGLK